MIASALPRKSMGSFACLLTQEEKLLKEFEELLVALYVASPLVDRIKKWQGEDPALMKIKKGVKVEKQNQRLSPQGGRPMFKGKLSMPNV